MAPGGMHGRQQRHGDNGARNRRPRGLRDDHWRGRKGVIVAHTLFHRIAKPPNLTAEGLDIPLGWNAYA